MEKIEFIKQQLLKASVQANTTDIYKIKDALPSVSPTSGTSVSASESMSPVFKSSGPSLISSGVSKDHAVHFQSLVTTTPAYNRYNSQLDYTSQSDFRSSNQNVPTLFTPNADASPITNALGNVVVKATTSTEQGRSSSGSDKPVNPGGLSVPILPASIPDPIPPSKEEAIVKQSQVTNPVTPPNIMPPIELPLPKETNNQLLQYQEMFTTPRTQPDTHNMQEFVVNAATQKEFIAHPESFTATKEVGPESLSSISPPKITAKQDSFVAAINSIVDSLTGPQKDITYPTTLQGKDVPTVSLSERPMSPGILPGMFQGASTSSKHDKTNTKIPEQTLDTRNVNSEPIAAGQGKQLLPSIPMLPGLIPQLPLLRDDATNTSEQISYKTGDLYLPLPIVESQPNIPVQSKIESNKNITYTETTNTGTNTMLSEPIITLGQSNQETIHTTTNIGSFDQNFATSHLNKEPTRETVNTPQNREPAQAATSVDSFGNTATIDLLSLLFPGTQTPNAAEFANEVPKTTPDVMPEIVPANKVSSQDSLSISISASTRDDDGCHRIQDETGKTCALI